MDTWKFCRCCLSEGSEVLAVERVNEVPCCPQCARELALELPSLPMQSHSATEIREALDAGHSLWRVETGSEGEDDTLFGRTEEEVWSNLEDCTAQTRAQLEEQGWRVYEITIGAHRRIG